MKYTTKHPASGNPPMPNKAGYQERRKLKHPRKLLLNIQVNVAYGLPQSGSQSFSSSSTFSLPIFSLPLVRLLVSDASSFKGSTLIDQMISAIFMVMEKLMWRNVSLTLLYMSTSIFFRKQVSEMVSKQRPCSGKGF